LTFSNRPIGALKMLSKCKDFFSEDKRILIQSYANLAAVAIQNAWLFDEVRMTNRQLRPLPTLMKAQEDERLHLSANCTMNPATVVTPTVQLGLLGDAEPPIIRRIAELKAPRRSRTTSTGWRSICVPPAWIIWDW
jgi:hypothetical protein